LEPRKGLDLLVDGIAMAGRRLRRRPRLLVIGDGSLRERLLRRADEAGVDLHWRGNVDPDRIAGCYQEADLLAAPALYGESFGIVLLEALATGIPVVASKIEGYAELLRECPAAHLFRPGSAEELAEGIGQLLPMTRDRRLRAQARLFALGFSWQRVAAMTEAVFLEALGVSRAPTSRVNLSRNSDLEPRARSTANRTRIRQA
jgi:phosphatidylinositol alpha-mannosyltransferase